MVDMDELDEYFKEYKEEVMKESIVTRKKAVAEFLDIIYIPWTSDEHYKKRVDKNATTNGGYWIQRKDHLDMLSGKNHWMVTDKFFSKYIVAHNHNGLHYDTSWDALMPALIKYKAQGNTIIMNFDHCIINDDVCDFNVKSVFDTLSKQLLNEKNIKDNIHMDS